jgi:hypothetical protein
MEITLALDLRFPDRKVERIVLGDLDFENQMKTMMRARVLVAPHGAGLTHMIHMQPSTFVLEIQNHPKYFSALFGRVAIGLNISYRTISPWIVSPGVVDYSRANVSQIVEIVAANLQQEEINDNKFKNKV